MLRKENDPADATRVKGVMDYLVLQLPNIHKFLEPEEKRLLILIWDHWRQFKEGVSRHELGEIVHCQDKSDGMTAVLNAYDDYVHTFKGSYDAISTMSLMNRCLDDYQSYMFANFLTEARGIANGGVTAIPEKGKKSEPDRIGLQDARTFLIEKLQSPLFSKGRCDQGGWIKDIASDLASGYMNDKARAADHSLLIPTGISAFDSQLGGLYRRDRARRPPIDRRRAE